MKIKAMFGGDHLRETESLTLFIGGPNQPSVSEDIEILYEVIIVTTALRCHHGYQFNECFSSLSVTYEDITSSSPRGIMMTTCFSTSCMPYKRSLDKTTSQ